ncbi:ArnT family glycosyltransferase [Patescibacteria group bacterium]
MINYLNKTFRTPNWLFVVMTLVFVFRIPSFFEPYAYGDEMIYLTLGEGVRQGVTLYGEIHDNKPPLLYLTAAAAGSVFWFRAILAIWHIITIYIFWKLLDHLFPNNRIVQIASTITFTILTTIPMFEGQIANSEIFMIGFTILGFLLLLKNRSVRNSFLAGILFSIASMFKIPAAFDMPAIMIYFLIVTKLNWKNIKSLFVTFFYMSIGFILPIAISFIYYYLQGAFAEYAIAGYLQNVGYLSSFRPEDISEPFLTKNAPLLTRGVVVLILSAVVFLFRKKLSKPFILVFVWLIFTLFAVALPERPYPHYLIQSIPPLSIMIGMLFGLSTLEQVLVVFPLSLTFFVPIYFKFWKYETTPYYQRFIDYSLGSLSENDYKSGFGEHVVVDEKVSEFVATTTSRNDRIYVWGDNATIYAKSKRLPPIKWVADYHIHDFSDKQTVAEELREKKPVYIIIIPNSEPYPELNQLINNNYFLVKEIEGVRIWKLSNSP